MSDFNPFAGLPPELFEEIKEAGARAYQERQLSRIAADIAVIRRRLPWWARAVLWIRERAK